MTDKSRLRFEGEKVLRVYTVTERGTLEIEFADPRGNIHVVSLPLAAAVELGCLICDVSDAAPYMLGGVRRSSASRP